MAINPETQYPGKIAPSTPGYPYGAARNVTIPGDGTGTPWESALVNDMFGFQQALLSRASVVPSGTPDNALISEYLKSLLSLTSFNLEDYDDVRNFDSSELKDGTLISIRGDNKSGIFTVKSGAVTDNGGTLLVFADDSNRYAQRLILDNVLYAEWFESYQLDQGSGFDITPALNTIFALVSSTPEIRQVVWGRGTAYCNTLPNDIDFKLCARGHGKRSTIFVKNFVSSNVEEGIFNFREGANGSVLEAFQCLGDTGSRSGGAGTGSLVNFVASATGAPDYCTLREYVLTNTGGTSNSMVEYSLHIDGTARTTAPIGIRDLDISDGYVFGGEEGSAQVLGVVNANVKFSAFAAGGDSSRVRISGTSSVKTQSVKFEFPVIAGDLSIDQSLKLAITGNVGGDLTNASSAEYIAFFGNVAGSAQKFWVRSRVFLGNSQERVLTGVAIAATTAYTQVHNLGSVPTNLTVKLNCISAELGYSVNDEIYLSNNDITCFANDTHIRYTTGPAIEIVRRDTGALANIDFLKWELVLIATL